MVFDHANLSWFWIAFAGYFLVAMETILDKFLLASKKISHPAVYAFYSATLSLFVLVFLLTGRIHWLGWEFFLWSLICGTFFVYGIMSLFFALRSGEASRAVPVSGAVQPIVIALISFFVLNERLDVFHWLGMISLIFGGLLISWEKKATGRFFGEARYAVSSGFLLAISSVIFKWLSINQSFINVFFWTRLGLFFGALFFFFIPDWRMAIANSFKIVSQKTTGKARTQSIFILNKVLGGVGSFLNNFAITLGSAAVVTAMVSIEYVFIFILGIIFAWSFPYFFREDYDGWKIWQKLLASAIIGLGVYLLFN